MGWRSKLVALIAGTAMLPATVVHASAPFRARDAFGPRVSTMGIAPACQALEDPLNVPVSDPRLLHTTVAGVPVDVLLPVGYDTSTRSYPVLYLIHGAFEDQNEMTAQTDLISYTGALPETGQALVVLPDQTNLPAATDWNDGSRLQETFLLKTLVPYIDVRYRTLADRAYRSIAGFSGGGLDAMLLAARHPDLFVAAGSFSGFVNQLTPRGLAVVEAFTIGDSQACGFGEGPFAIWGDPVTDQINWRDHDPTDLAGSMVGVMPYVASGNGISCPSDPEPQSLEAGLVQENTVYEMNHDLAAALTKAGIAPVEDFYGCGTHIGIYIQRDIHVFWPLMTKTFGTAPPTAFNFRTADCAFAVWGWSFRCDPGRAAEFLDIRGASARGLQLTGSGIESITTSPLFRPAEMISIAGTGQPAFAARADSSGQLSFTVNMGTAHARQQYTPEETLLETAGGYFTTATVSLTPVQRHS